MSVRGECYLLHKAGETARVDALCTSSYDAVASHMVHEDMRGLQVHRLAALSRIQNMQHPADHGEPIEAAGGRSLPGGGSHPGRPTPPCWLHIVGETDSKYSLGVSLGPGYSRRRRHTVLCRRYATPLCLHHGCAVAPHQPTSSDMGTLVYAATPFGRATFRAQLETHIAKMVYSELVHAQSRLVLGTELHLLYLVTPVDAGVKPTDMDLYIRCVCYKRYITVY